MAVKSAIIQAMMLYKSTTQTQKNDLLEIVSAELDCNIGARTVSLNEGRIKEGAAHDNQATINLRAIHHTNTNPNIYLQRKQ